MVATSFINRLSEAVDRIECRSQPRSWKVVQIPRGYDEDPDAARDRHFAAHPEDRDADVVIWHFCDDEGTTDESQDLDSPTGS
jgi:hypothetical protein